MPRRVRIRPRILIDASLIAGVALFGVAALVASIILGVHP
jgi:hypothetical protein